MLDSALESVGNEQVIRIQACRTDKEIERDVLFDAQAKILPAQFPSERSTVLCLGK